MHPANPANSRQRLRLVRGGGGTDGKALSDEALVDAFEQGDADAANGLYDRLIGVVDSTLYRVMGRREADHDDLVQSVFEQIVLTLSRGRFARACSLKGWAAAIATHVALNAVRSRVRERRVLDRNSRDGADAMDPRASNNVERDASTREAFDRLRSSLAQMDPAKAVTVYLHDGMGHDLAEIATLTHVSVAAAQSRLVRGRRELRERLQELETGSDRKAGRP